MDLLWQRHEQEFARIVPGGQSIIGSGRLVEKMDVQTDRDGSYWRFLYSLKCTQRKSFRFGIDWWEEVCRAVESRSVEMRPALGLRFYGPGTVNVRAIADLVVCSLDDWAELLSVVRGGDGDSAPVG